MKSFASYMYCFSISISLVFISPVSLLGKTPNTKEMILNPTFDTTAEGIVNIYTPVLKILTDSCYTTNIDVVSTNGFSVNDKVLIIQMQGATIDSQNHEGYGTIEQYNDAGNYEFARIKTIKVTILHCNIHSYTHILHQGKYS